MQRQEIGKLKTFLVDLDRCIGCYACEIACKDENDLAPGIRRVKIEAVEAGEFNRFYVPVFQIDTRGASGCTLCTQLQVEGRRPACVHNCLTNALFFGESGEIEAKVDDMAGENYVAPYKRANVIYVSRRPISDKIKLVAKES